MSRSKASFGGLGSRVALRTFLFFCMSALVPILIFAALADRIVIEKLTRQAADRLQQTSKSYGLLLFDRLTQTEAALNDLADQALDGQLSVDKLERYSGDRFSIVAAAAGDYRQVLPASAFTQGLDRVSRLKLHEAAGLKSVAIELVKSRGGRSIALTATVSDAYLWNADAVLPDSADICVTSTQLHRCIVRDPRMDEGAPLTASWSLFLAPRFGSDDWTIVTRQPRSQALQALRSFEHMFPIATSIAILLASLLSVIHIRRSHRPLTLLTRAATLMGRSRMHGRLEIRSNDEYEQLGRAFNFMSRALSRQFTLLRALGRVDRMILSDPTPEVIIAEVLPSLPRHLRTRTVILALTDTGRKGLQLFIARPDSKHLEHVFAPERSVEEIIGTSAPSWVADAVTLDESQALFGLPVEVGGTVSGALLFGNPRRNRRNRVRNARAFARRFAIALGSSERQKALVRQAYYDELTGLPNRRLFKERLEHDLLLAKRSQRRLALIYIDLDRFKHVNDSLGHSAGDTLLVAVCDRLKATVRDTDTLCRLGGDEFVLIASDIDREPAHVLAARLQAALQQPIVIQESHCFVEASIGLTIYPEDGDSVETLLRNADIAMYGAKAAGRGGVTYFEEHMNRDAQQRLRVEHRLRLALQSDSLMLHYQPKVNLADGSLLGVEALARWNDAELGPVSPAVFIPIAEECGLIETLGSWALHEACRAHRRLSDAGVEVGHVSVNASMRQLNSAGFVDDVKNALRESSIAPDALEIELTESSLAENPQQMLSLLAQLRALGVGISIDDFGTGYSSMSSLAVLPADTLKIDRSFVVNCTQSQAAQSVVAAIISVAHVLEKKVVAEGVETLEQMHTLRMLGCDGIQGYLIGKPMPESSLLRLPGDLTNWRQLADPLRAAS